MLHRAMNPQKHPQPTKPTHKITAATVRAQRPDSMRNTVLLSLIVCPNGGVAHRRHGLGAKAS
jgi:hypothetical protein